jgi:hypothetical protein
LILLFIVTDICSSHTEYNKFYQNAQRLVSRYLRKKENYK